MKIAIISRNPKLYSTDRMAEEATDKNVAGMIIDFIEKQAKPGSTKTRGQG